jgi:RNA polymerase sigma-70 factor (ECF subfamily)
MPINTIPTMPGHSVAELKDEVLKAIPKLRAYARNLCRSSERADDLVQEALVKALTHINTFVPGSNLSAWLYTILRNEFYSAFRKGRREVEDNGDHHAALLQVRPVQEGHMHFLDVRDALTRLTAEHREALMLIVSGLSYEEAAVMCGCAAGTMKSRISRARDKLAEMFDDRQATVGYGEDRLVPGSSDRMDIGRGALRMASVATI